MAPTSMTLTYGLNGYDEANAYLENYASEHDAVYFDLNLMRNREELLPDSMMRDNTHVNGEGAKVATQCLVNCINADINGEDAGQYLYDSIEELKAECNRITGVKADISIEGGLANVSISSKQNETIEPLYKVEIASADVAYTAAKDWSAESECSIPVPASTPYTIKVTAARNPDDAEPAWMTYSFE